MKKGGISTFQSHSNDVPFIHMSLINFAKHIYDNYPGLVKKLGLLELAAVPPYRSLYMKSIEQKMQAFNNGAIAVEFEVTNNCNADCTMCPNSLMERPIAKMEMDLFKRIVDEFAVESLPLIKFVFAGIGEPTLDPLLPEKIRYLKEKIPMVPVQLTTNASLLTEKKSRELIDAGVGYFGLFHQQSWIEIRRTLQTNLSGALFLCHAVLPHMVKQKSGMIVNVSSVIGKRAIADLASYCASKFGLWDFSHSLRLELKEFGIQVCHFCPRATATEFQNLAGFKPDSRADSSETVAKAMVRAVLKQKSEHIMSIRERFLIKFWLLAPNLTDRLLRLRT